MSSSLLLPRSGSLLASEHLYNSQMAIVACSTRSATDFPGAIWAIRPEKRWCMFETPKQIFDPISTPLILSRTFLRCHQTFAGIGQIGFAYHPVTYPPCCLHLPHIYSLFFFMDQSTHEFLTWYFRSTAGDLSRAMTGGKIYRNGLSLDPT